MNYDLEMSSYICPDCSGAGGVDLDDPDGRSTIHQPCPTCRGTGYVYS